MEVTVPGLLDAILEAWTKCLKPPYGDSDFSPEDGQTDCNRFVQLVCEKLGHAGMKGLRANQMFDYLLNNKQEWSEVSGVSATYYANKGYLVIAAWKNPDAGSSGHVCVVRPGNAVTSNKWKYTTPSVPMVANVGPAERCRMDRGANWAFKDEPKYYLWKALTNGRPEERS